MRPLSAGRIMIFSSFFKGQLLANPGVKFKLLFQFVYCCTRLFRESPEKITSIDPEKISNYFFQIPEKAVGKFALKFKLTQS